MDVCVVSALLLVLLPAPMIVHIDGGLGAGVGAGLRMQMTFRGASTSVVFLARSASATDFLLLFVPPIRPSCNPLDLEPAEHKMATYTSC